MQTLGIVITMFGVIILFAAITIGLLTAQNRQDLQDKQSRFHDNE